MAKPQWSRYDVSTESGGFSIFCWDEEGTEDGFAVWSDDLAHLVQLAEQHEAEHHA